MLKILQENKLASAIIIVQALALLIIYKLLTHETLDFNLKPYFYLPLLAIFIPLPTMALLVLDKKGTIAKPLYLFLVGFILAATGLYLAWQLLPVDRIPAGAAVFIYVATMFIACFKALMYLQQKELSEKISYSSLFTLSWRNTLTLALAALFTGVFWAVLMLWAGLFKVLKISFFAELFKNEWFFIPVSVAAFGTAILVFRNYTSIVDSFSRILQALIKMLLPLLCVVSISFLVTLPFAGVGLLWDAGLGTSLILWLQALTLFFVNAVYRDEPEARPYPIWLHRLVYISVACLFVYSILAFYGLYLRVDQYGWTVSRCWAFVLWFLLGLFSVGYLIGIVKHRDAWTFALDKVNVSMGLVVMVVMVLVNTPALDFRKISVSSQFARMDSGEVKLEDFDFRYVKRNLLKPGYARVESLKSEIAKDTKGAERFYNLYPVKYNFGKKQKSVEISKEQVEDLIRYIPEDLVLDEELKGKIIDSIEGDVRRSTVVVDNNIITSHEALVVAADLNQDGELGYISVVKNPSKGSQNAKYWRKNKKFEWRSEYMRIKGGLPDLTTLKADEISTQEKVILDLKVGDALLKPYSNNY